MTDQSRARERFQNSWRLASRKMAGLLAGFFMIGLMAGLSAITEPAIAQSGMNADPSKLDCPSTCKASPRIGTSREIILNGETVTSSLHIRVHCLGVAQKQDIAIVVDPDDQMSRSEFHNIKKDLAKLIIGLGLPRNPHTRIGLISASSQAQTTGRLSNDEAQVISDINRVEYGSTQDLAAGIDLARRLLRGSTPDCERFFVNKMMITLSSDVATGNCNAVSKAARKVKSEGVLSMAVCAQNRCRDSRCLRNEVASSPRYFFSSLFELNQVRLVVEGIRNAVPPVTNLARPDIINITTKQVSIVEHLAEGLEYVPGSAIPDAEWSEDVRTLTWPVYGFMPKDGVTLSYRTKPLYSGDITISEGAEITWRDNLNHEGASILPATSVLVLGGRIGGEAR